MERRNTKKIKVGNVCIGGSSPIAIQSMVKVQTKDVAHAVRQIKDLQKAGCDIVRLAIKDMEDAAALKRIKPKIKIPIVADIHFSKEQALKCIQNGADKIRLNPGNIRDKKDIVQIVKAAKKKKIPIRVGVNSGSVGEHGRDLPSVMVKSAMNYIDILEDMDFFDIVISLKASNVKDTIDAYRLISKKCDYPMHLGITATGLPESGAIKSSVGIGALLAEGIGDTIRVSLTTDPVKEVLVAKEILKALDLKKSGIEVISCPTCGRCRVNMVDMVRDFEAKLPDFKNKKVSAKVAIMGCEVNGPGEAQDADIGIAAGCGCGVLFKKGKIVRKIKESDFVSTLLKEIKKL